MSNTEALKARPGGPVMTASESSETRTDVRSDWHPVRRRAFESEADPAWQDWLVLVAIAVWRADHRVGGG